MQYTNGKLFIHEKKVNTAACNSRNGTWGSYAKWNKPDKDKYFMVSLLHGNKKKNKNKKPKILIIILRVKKNHGQPKYVTKYTPINMKHKFVRLMTPPQPRPHG